MNYKIHRYEIPSHDGRSSKYSNAEVSLSWITDYIYCKRDHKILRNLDKTQEPSKLTIHFALSVPKTSGAHAPNRTNRIPETQISFFLAKIKDNTHERKKLNALQHEKIIHLS